MNVYWAFAKPRHRVRYRETDQRQDRIWSALEVLFGDSRWERKAEKGREKGKEEREEKGDE